MNKIISAVNWKNAVGEILLIVIGISVALTMDSWWEESKAHKDEISLLSQTLVTLRVDSEVLKERLSELRDRAHMFTELRQHVENQLPYTDELAPKFRLMTYWQTTGINTAPYEALKARGLDLISDQDLRLKLINYFDREVPRLEDRDAIDRIQTLEIFQPYFRTRFEWGHIPLDYEELIQDPEFLYILAHREAIYRNITVPRYELMVELTQDLIDALEAELSK